MPDQYNNDRSHFAELNSHLEKIEHLLFEQVTLLKSVEKSLRIESIPFSSVNVVEEPVPIQIEQYKFVEEPAPVHVEQYYIVEEPVPVQMEQHKTAVETLIEEAIEPMQSPIIEMIEARLEAVNNEPAEDPAPVKGYSLGAIERMIAGNWFHRVGIVAVIIGIGFFMREAVKRGWLPPLGRVAIGSLVGIGLITLGDRLRSSGYKIYSQSLTGGGIAILYLVTFSSFAMYNLVGQGTAFVLMTLVTAFSVYLSARYDAMSITILALFGGFLTPVMLSTGVDNQVGLFTYIALLDIGVLATAYFKRWRVINVLVYVITVAMFAGWMARWYDPSKLQTTIFFFTLFFVLFAVLTIFHNVVNKVKSDFLDISQIFINATLYFTVSYNLLHTENFGKLGLFAISIAAFYLALGYFTFSRDRSDKYLLFSFAGLAATFLTLAIPLQLDQHWTTIAWAVEGAALCWIGYKGENKTTQYAALPILLVAVVHWFKIDFMMFGYVEGQSFLPFLNKRGISSLLVITSLTIAYRYYRKLSKVSNEEGLPNICIFIASSMAFIWLTKDLWDYFSSTNADTSAKDVGITLIWSVYAFLLFIFSRVLKSVTLRKIANIVAIFPIMKVLYFTLMPTIMFGYQNGNQLINPYSLNHAFVIGLLIYMMHINTDKGHLHTILTLTTHLFGLSMLSYESELLFHPNWLMALSVAWGVYGGVLLTIGILKDKPLLRYISFVLLVTTTLKVFLVDMSTIDAIYRVASFIVVGSILIAASFLYQKRFGKQNEP